MIRNMTAWCVALAAISMIVLGSFDGPGTTLSTQVLRESRGADQGSASCQDRCDNITGVYVDCTAVGAYCRQCGTEMMGMFFPSKAYYLGTPGDPGCSTNGGFMYGGGFQGCKNIYVGQCVADPDGPTGFKCILDDNGTVCSEGVENIIVQPL